MLKIGWTVFEIDLFIKTDNLFRYRHAILHAEDLSLGEKRKGREFFVLCPLGMVLNYFMTQ